MSALNRHEEFEQLLRGMRDRLVAVSEEVSRTVTKANWHAEMAPAHVRARVQAGIAEITHTQDWLQTRLAQLPNEPEQRYAAMQDMLQMQFVAVQKVTTILDELLALRNKPIAPEYLPSEQRPVQVPDPMGYPGYALGPLQAGTPIARDFGSALGSPATAPLFDPPAAHQPQHPRLMFPPPQQMHPQPHLPPEPQWGPLPSGFAPQAHVPGAVHLADLEPSYVPPMGPGDMPRAFAGRKPEAKPQPKGARKYKRAAPRSRLGMVTLGLVAAILLVGAGGYFFWGTVSGGTKSQRVAIGDPAARKMSNAGAASSPVRSVDPVATRVPQPPPMSAPPFPNAADDFVAVIATHREKDGLTNMFMELRKQYPDLVGARKAIAQTVNLGTDGVWYQLVLLPAGPRAQAEGVCEELRRAGYPRCAVRPNKP